VRNLARRGGWSILTGGLFVLLAGFGPGGSCAKACRETGEHADEVAHVAPRVTPPVRPRGAVIPPGGVGDVAGDLGHLMPSSLDEAVAALPEPDGAIAKLATTPTANGKLMRIDGSRRSFARDYGRSVDDLGLQAAQHEELIDVFGIAQDLAMEVIESLVTDDDDPSAAKTREAARRRLRDAADALDARLAEILTPEQYAALAAKLGSAELIAYRLGREKPIGKAR
jgi:hypothetical protein